MMDFNGIDTTSTFPIFRLNETSEYTADFNPMDVLEVNLTWSGAEKYR
jgi:hypothetical protein